MQNSSNALIFSRGHRVEIWNFKGALLPRPPSGYGPKYLPSLPNIIALSPNSYLSYIFIKIISNLMLKMWLLLLGNKHRFSSFNQVAFHSNGFLAERFIYMNIMNILKGYTFQF